MSKNKLFGLADARKQKRYIVQTHIQVQRSLVASQKHMNRKVQWQTPGVHKHHTKAAFFDSVGYAIDHIKLLE